MAREIGPQPLRLAKRLLLTPLAGPAHRWALSGKASSLKHVVLRHVVLPGFAAGRRDFERRVGSGLVFHGNSEDFLPAMVRMFGVWEPILTEFLHRRLKPGRVFVDVGANLGWFTTVASRCVSPTGSVVAIEAAPRLFDQLAAQVARNHLANVRTVNTAVGATEGRVGIRPGPRTHTGLTRVVTTGSGPGDEVPLSPLTSILAPDEIARCRVVKIDVEGSEYEVVRGMRGLLPLLPADAEIVIEVGPDRAKLPTDVAELFNLFAEAGYHPYKLPNVYSVEVYRNPSFPAVLERLRDRPTVETDVVFSRTDESHLPF